MKEMGYSLFALTIGCFLLGGAHAQDGHFHPKGKTGWIVFDPLTAKETAKAALDFIKGIREFGDFLFFALW